MTGLNVARAVALLAALLSIRALAADVVSIGDRTFINKGLVGVGRIPAGLLDKFGETFGSGSGIAADLKTWARTEDGYRGEFFLLPDRGYNVKGTIDYRTRVQRLSIAFKPEKELGVLPVTDRQHTVIATLIDTIGLTDAAGQPLTGLDPAEGGIRPAASGFPDLPQASNGRVSIDAESLVLMRDGSFFVGDEYGPHAGIRGSAAALPGRAWAYPRSGAERALRAR
jgi:hypothetical protein